MNRETRKMNLLTTSRAPDAPLDAITPEVPAETYVPEPLAGASRISATPHFHEDRFALIAEIAYRFAQERQFASGHELEDWLAAEELVDFRLIGEGRAF
jgi:hypothetical protein